jgi:uncharacterized damage-inducible protein DinB
VDVDAVAVDGTWIRHAPHRSSLLGRAAEPTDGRWQRGETVRGLYLADERATAVAEWYRLLTERGLPPARAIPHDHHGRSSGSMPNAKETHHVHHGAHHRSRIGLDRRDG